MGYGIKTSNGVYYYHVSNSCRTLLDESAKEFILGGTNNGKFIFKEY